MAKRRSAEEVLKLVAEIDALKAGGMSAEDAFKKVGLAGSVYQRHKRGEVKGRVSGSVRADSLPPRPKKKGGKRVPKKLDMNDIGAVAVRIARLDKKLHSIDDMVRERIMLVGVLVKLLKAK